MSDDNRAWRRRTVGVTPGLLGFAVDLSRKSAFLVAVRYSPSLAVFMMNDVAVDQRPRHGSLQEMFVKRKAMSASTSIEN
jgi:hypothetical protein